MRKKVLYIILLIIEIILWMLSVLSIIDTCVFIYSKREATAKIEKIEKAEKPKPYILTLIYYNEYEHKYITSKVKNISGLYGRKLDINSNINVLYGKRFPSVTYLSDCKHPNYGQVIVLLVFFLILSFAIYFNISTLKKK